MAPVVARPPPAAAMAAVIEACKAGAKVVDVCEKGDSIMVECVPGGWRRAALVQRQHSHAQRLRSMRRRGRKGRPASQQGGCQRASVGLALLGLTPPPPPAGCCRGVGKEFQGKEIEKGIAVPTCISVNK